MPQLGEKKLAMSLWGVGAAQDVLLSAALLWMLVTSRGGAYFQRYARVIKLLKFNLTTLE
jgi:hypothetical protein